MDIVKDRMDITGARCYAVMPLPWPQLIACFALSLRACSVFAGA